MTGKLLTGILRLSLLTAVVILLVTLRRSQYLGNGREMRNDGEEINFGLV